MYREHEIRTENCSDTCQHKDKIFLTFTKNDLTLIDIYAITFGRMSDQSANCTGQHQKCSKSQMSDCYFVLCICITLIMYYTDGLLL